MIREEGIDSCSFDKLRTSFAGMTGIEYIKMVAMNEIKEFGRQIGHRFGAEKVILFGSYAEGTATRDSDIDLLVVARTNLPYGARYGAVRCLLEDYPAGFDIIVETPEEFARWRSVVNHIVYFADKYGKVIYERPNP
jgi:predicted nucleotidyltransferase